MIWIFRILLLLALFEIASHCASIGSHIDSLRHEIYNLQYDCGRIASSMIGIEEMLRQKPDADEPQEGSRKDG